MIIVTQVEKGLSLSFKKEVGDIKITFFHVVTRS